MAISHVRSVAIFFCCLLVGRALPIDDMAGSPLSAARADHPVKPQSQPNQGQLLLRRARAALNGHTSVGATIHERIRLYGQELVGKGIFVQGPPEQHLMKLDLSVKISGQDNFVQQWCDGRYFWEQKLIDGIPSLTRIDVRRVLAARRTAAKLETANGSPPELPALGLGGVAFLLDQLDTWCLFQRWGESKLNDREKTPVFVLEGSWRPEQLVAWLPDQRAAVENGQPLNLDKLPLAFPDRILISLGRDDLFPRRIEYGASASRRFENNEAPLVQIHFEGVQFDQPIKVEAFKFEGSVTAPLDVTDSYLMSHGLVAPEAGQ